MRPALRPEDEHRRAQRDGTPARAPGLARTFAASTAVLGAGLALLLHATALGNAFTTETLRRTQVDQAPRPVPALAVTDGRSAPQALTELLAGDGRVVIVDFVYTRCQTLCLALGTVFQQLQARIVERGLQDRIGLLSISFDPAQDSAATLDDYARRLRMDPAVWRVLTLAQPQDRRALLDAFGILVIPAPLGEFEHNAALHVVDPDGRLLRILDLTEIEPALQAALAAAGSRAPGPVGAVRPRAGDGT
jgi:protein SCO1/2